MKTTPKPSATKNNNGELVGPPPPLEESWLLPVLVWVGLGDAVVVVLDMVAASNCADMGQPDIQCRKVGFTCDYQTVYGSDMLEGPAYSATGSACSVDVNENEW